jgi:hypothetical protein
VEIFGTCKQEFIGLNKNGWFLTELPTWTFFMIFRQDYFFGGVGKMEIFGTCKAEVFWYL